VSDATNLIATNIKDVSPLILDDGLAITLDAILWNSAEPHLPQRTIDFLEHYEADPILTLMNQVTYHGGM